MKTAIRSAIGLVLVSSSIARDFRPQGRLENIPATDTSVQQCYIFRTVPRVIYRVESCSNLSNWNSGEGIYGMGHELVTAMREFTPSPPPPGGGNSPPVPVMPAARLVGLSLHRSSGAPGGIVVSWRSLDDGSPVNLWLDQSMAADWIRMPYFSERYGNFYFFIGCDSVHPIPPPAENPALVTKDTKMLALFEANFPAMNETVIANTARARNAPDPAPPDPNSRKFWRVFCDWGVDTDQDGSPDWAEFEMTGAAADGLRGDAFTGDTNHNGIPDGEELDYDQDGVADAKDQGLDDASATYQIGPVPRYALFPITNAEATPTPPESLPLPIQINDLGTVLYQNGTWAAGVWTPLTGTGPGLTGATARAINDRNIVIGFAKPTDPSMNFSRICYWPDTGVNAVPVAIATADNPPFLATTDSDGANGTGGDFVTNLLSPGPILSNDGRFHMGTSRWDRDDGRYEFAGYGQWTLPAAGQTVVTRAEGSRGLRYAGTDGWFWGMRPLPSNPFAFDGGILHAADSILETDFLPTNAALLPGNRILAMPDRKSRRTALAWYNGAWTTRTLYSQALDISADGIAIGRIHDGRVAPILLNGKWTDISNCAPDLPENWKQPATAHLDTTPGGWILTRDNDPAVGETHHAVMLPIKLDPSGPPVTARTHWDGVDGISTGAENVPAPVRQGHWMMVPLGGGDTRCILKSPLSAESKLTLSGSHLLFNGQQEAELAAAENEVTVSTESGYATASGTEADVVLKLGSAQSACAPLKVKFMKRRTVKVNLYHVKLGATGPDFSLLHTEVQNFLNNVYTDKINVDFAVPPAVVLPGAWDADGDGLMDALPENDLHAEQSNILGQRPANTPVSNIDLFLMSGGQFKVSDGTRELPAWGVTNRAARCIWIHAGLLADPANPGPQNTWRTNGDVGQTLSHEVGHIFTEYGHPDEEDGISPLKGTDRSLRLMHSGEKTRGGRLGTMLVKEEWDAAEAWLSTEIDKTP